MRTKFVIKAIDEKKKNFDDRDVHFCRLIGNKLKRSDFHGFGKYLEN